MNKMVKGALAGTTGIALLMGGFGTYATWTDTQDIDGKIASGTLSIDSAGDASYDDLNTSTLGDWTATDLMVPGDKVQLTQPLAVTAKGKNLKVKLSVTGVSSDFDFAGTGGLKVTATYAGRTVTFPGNAPYVMTWTAADFAALNDATAAVVTFELPADATGNMDKTLDLTGAVIHLDQVL